MLTGIVYHEILVTTLELVPTVLNHHLPLNETKSGKVKLATNSKKFQSLSPMIKSHAGAVQHLLSSLTDDATLKLTLNSIIPLLPYVLSLKKFLRTLVKSIVEVWSQPGTEEATKITAFLVIRRLVVIGDPGIREAVLKTVYQALVTTSSKTNIHNLQAINLMKNTAAELWGLDENVGYISGFNYIRQLAVHLRNSITSKSNPSAGGPSAKESYKSIYNWQYVHSLDFWSRVLSLHCDGLKEAQAGKESALRPLIYPVVQITLGAMRLIPTAQYFPLRFQLIRSLLRISRTTGTYIPLAPVLVEVLQSRELRKAPKASTHAPLDMKVLIRVPKSYLHTRVLQDGLGEEVTELLAEFFVLWTKSIAFPELALPVAIILRRWIKESSHRVTGNKNPKITSALVLLVQKLNANTSWVEEKRNKVEFAPNDRSQVDAFLKDENWEKTPLGAFVVGQRRSKEEKEKVLERGRREDETRRNKERNGKSGLDEMDVDSD
jgi:nucleolar complex protein 2